MKPSGLTQQQRGGPRARRLVRKPRERIRQIGAEALRKLKHPSRSRKLRRFLDN